MIELEKLFGPRVYLQHDFKWNDKCSVGVCIHKPDVLVRTKEDVQRAEEPLQCCHECWERYKDGAWDDFTLIGMRLPQKIDIVGLNNADFPEMAKAIVANLEQAGKQWRDGEW